MTAWLLECPGFMPQYVCGRRGENGLTYNPWKAWRYHCLTDVKRALVDFSGRYRELKAVRHQFDAR